MGKSQIKSYCQISNHSILGLNHLAHFSLNLKSFSDKSQIFYFRFKRDTFVYSFFHNIKNNVVHGQ